MSKSFKTALQYLFLFIISISVIVIIAGILKFNIIGNDVILK